MLLFAIKGLVRSQNIFMWSWPVLLTLIVTYALKLTAIVWNPKIKIIIMKVWSCICRQFTPDLLYCVFCSGHFPCFLLPPNGRCMATWRHVYTLWYILSGIYSLVYTLWYILSGIYSWYILSGIYSLVYTLCYILSGIYSLVNTPWYILSGIYSLVYTLWYILSIIIGME